MRLIWHSKAHTWLPFFRLKKTAKVWMMLSAAPSIAAGDSTPMGISWKDSAARGAIALPGIQKKLAFGRAARNARRFREKVYDVKD